MTLLALAYDPAWTLPGVAASLVGVAVIIWGWRFADRLRKNPHCPRCHYDLRGHTAGDVDAPKLPVTCPECGRVVRKTRRLYKPRRHKRIIALGLLVVMAGSATALHPEVRDKGGWHFVAESTLMLLRMPHEKDPASSPHYDEVETRFARAMELRREAALGRSSIQNPSRAVNDGMWNWQCRLVIRQAIAAVRDGQTDECITTGLELLTFTQPMLDTIESPSVRGAYLESLLSALRSKSTHIASTAASQWPVGRVDPVLTGKFVDTLTDWQHGSDQRLKFLSLRLLSDRGLLDDRHIEPALSMLRPDTLPYSMGFQVVQNFPPPGTTLGPRLLEIAENRHWSRAHAIAALITMGDAMPDQAKHLIDLLFASTNPEDIELILEACGHAGANSIRYKQEILALIADKPEYSNHGFHSFVTLWGELTGERLRAMVSGRRVMMLSDLDRVLNGHDTMRRIALIQALRADPAHAEWLLVGLDRVVLDHSETNARLAAASAARAIRQALSQPHP